jgi:hypothetical protein
MESGFIADRAALGVELQSRWVEGKPTPRFFFEGVRGCRDENLFL